MRHKLGAALGLGILVATGSSLTIPYLFGQSTAWQPLVYEQTERFMKQDGTLARVETTVHAIRGDGSTVEIRFREIPGTHTTTQQRIVTDYAALRRVSIDGLTESVTTYPIPSVAVERLAAAPACTDPAAHHDVMLGYDVVEGLEEHPMGHNQIRRSYWRAPALNCLAMKEVSTVISNGTQMAGNIREVTSIQLSPPDPAWFDVPLAYTERAPSEVMAELSRRYPSTRGGTPGATLQILDNAYASARIASN